MVRSKPMWVALTAVIVACGTDTTSPALSLPGRPSASTALALGTQFSCALTDESKLYCWGNDLSGQLGDSSFSQKLIPTATAGGHSYVVVAAGVQTACALDQAGAAWCWGDDPSQAGIPVSFRNVPAVARADRPFVSLTVGRKFACGIDSDGNAYCWGENAKGQLGVGDTLPHTLPTRVTGGQRFSQITAGFWHVCALNTSGAAYCWGDNAYGELGSGDTLGSTKPRADERQHDVSLARRGIDSRMRNHQDRRGILLGRELLRPTRHRHRRPAAGSDRGHGRLDVHEHPGDARQQHLWIDVRDNDDRRLVLLGLELKEPTREHVQRRPVHQRKRHVGLSVFVPSAQVKRRVQRHGDGRRPRAHVRAHGEQADVVLGRQRARRVGRRHRRFRRPRPWSSRAACGFRDLVFSDQPASASASALTGSGSSVFGASHSLPHLRHFRKSPRALVNFISAPT